MAASRRALLVSTSWLLLVCLGCLACVNPLDPLNREDDFRRLQKRFTAYVRWGKVHEAAVFVVEDQRREFLELAPEFSDIRFTDYEITRLDYERSSANVDVTLRGYRLSTPVEHVVNLAQHWERSRGTGWQVRLELADLKRGLGTP